MKMLIIIPAFNEEDNIINVVKELKQKYPNYDYIVINDGSYDRTSRLCKENNINLISLPLNLGLTGAFRTGMKYAYRNDYDCALQFDADGQHDPVYIDKLLNDMQSNEADIVIGSRYIQDKKSFSLRAIGNTIISFFIWITTGHKIYDSTSGMRLYSRRIMRFYAQSINFDPEPDTIAYLIRCGAKVDEVQVKIRRRTGGKSYLQPAAVVSYMVRICSSILFMQWFRKKIDL